MPKQVRLKCIVVGRHDVGKSSLVERFMHERFQPAIGPTVGAAFVAKDITVGKSSGKKTVSIGVWDTAGSERYQAMTRHYYQGAQAAVVCYDLTEKESWDKVRFWVKEITESRGSDCLLVLVGCKADLLRGPDAKARAAPLQAIEQYAATINAKTYECSALTGDGVAAPFVEICADFAAMSGYEAGQGGGTVPLGSGGSEGSKLPCCK